MSSPRAVVIGQLARDLVLQLDQWPEVGHAADVGGRREMLGGKGANQAVALAQLGVTVALVAVAGDDDIGDSLLAQATRDGVDVTQVVRRPDTSTGLIVEALDGAGRWRYLQHLPNEVLLTATDVEASAELLRAADAVLVQLQQPPAATLGAARLAHDAGRLVVVDGAPASESDRPALLAVADVVRTDAHETRLWTAAPTDDIDRVLTAAGDILAAGPRLLAFGVNAGNLFAWRDQRWGDGHLLVPLTDQKVVDTTGAGDALVAALTAALLRGDPPPTAARHAVAAAGATVGHPGGRPSLSQDALRAGLGDVAAKATTSTSR
ncbi:PfkB family carbohydrate kinase [Micromonospora sp. U21]|uniref:PfkB family carbohydrate kinase n=1 Tax=Micromonospora sp. U21 TaxID=2824899 RepID=UPI001B38C03F|nr:PfkB family carbohydrate kinase [Micromonospora sp. U21]MBQ0902118.1 carbohydrate kinase [Micromonospora sp. U21]